MDSPLWDLDDDLILDNEALDGNNNLDGGGGGGAAANASKEVTLRAVSELEPKYRRVFPYVHLNHVQSLCFDTIMQTKEPLLVCAPTGSGKTGVLELAIIRVLMDCYERNIESIERVKMIYLAPTRALCAERKEDWANKFQSFGLQCVELTGDYNVSTEKFLSIQKSSLLLATPEKWDSITRAWNDHGQFAAAIRLVMIDEIHLVNDGPRGATLEAVISRMKTMRSIIWPSNQEKMRFVGISATISNTDDMAQWLSTPTTKCRIYQVDPKQRPVKLKTLVLGFSYSGGNEFGFDNLMTTKLNDIINQHSECKPTLIFCSTRKSALNTAMYLTKRGRLDVSFNVAKRRQYLEISHRFKDAKLQETTRFGIAYHHAGLDLDDRKLIERGFLEGKIMILASTSTLSVGVNLPAHLVIIKTTTFYHEGRFIQYGESSIIQMIGRAGRPQFDTHATAVILTRMETRARIEELLRGSLIVDSHLHENMVEHLNSEIVLQTVSNEVVAMQWLKSTYLYVRMCKNPEKYGMQPGCSISEIDSKLDSKCKSEIENLLNAKLIERDRNFRLLATENGKAMARYYICYTTMCQFNNMSRCKTLESLLDMVCSTKEIVAEILIRKEETGPLDRLKKGMDSDQLRFTIRPSVCTCSKSPPYHEMIPVICRCDSMEKEEKANILIQAVFGCIAISDHAINQEALRIVRNAQRVVGCLRQVTLMADDFGFKTTLNVFILTKCFAAKIWENSIYVAKQLDKIGITYSRILALNGLTTFESLRNADPRNLETLLSRQPPIGSVIQQTCCGLPKYRLSVHSSEIQSSDDICELMVNITLENGDDLRVVRTVPANHTLTLIVGNSADNRIIMIQKISDTRLLSRPDFTITVGRTVKKIWLPYYTEDLEVHLISDSFVGLDVSLKQKFSENY